MSCPVEKSTGLGVRRADVYWIWWTIGANHSIKLDFTCKMRKLALDIFEALVWEFCLSHIFQKVPELLIVQGPQSFVWWQVAGGRAVFIWMCLGCLGSSPPREGTSSVTQAGRFPELLSCLQSENAMRMIILTLLVSQGCVRIKWDNSCENIFKIIIKRVHALILAVFARSSSL